MAEESFIAIAMLIAIALALWVGMLKWSNRKLRRRLAAAAQPAALGAPDAVAALPHQRAPERDQEVERLRDRVAVLERITCDKESTLSRDIESLRHR
ncbi:MAG: hypothetical protein M3Q88_04225 [Pseudomonadota bacterium]|nr:hypothetical protein [Pseudomonadota bacterium]